MTISVSTSSMSTNNNDNKRLKPDCGANTNKRPLTRYGRDGANYTSRATFDCFYDPENHDHVIIDYQV